METKKTLISIIVPVYNTEKHIERCLDSIMKQDYPNFEVILVNDGSTDESGIIIQKYKEKYKNISYIKQENKGVGAARNAGIKVAKGDYISFVDSDDYIDYNMYEELFDVIKCHDVDIVYSNFQTEYLDGRIDGCDKNSGQIYIRSSLDVLRDMMWDKLNCSSCTKLFKRTVFSEYKFPENNIYEDRIAMHMWILQCKQVAWVDKVFYHYVERSSSLCHLITPLNRYHYFMAEFSRIEFIEKHLLFEGEELLEVRNRLIRICFFTFEEFVLLTKPRCFQKPIRHMRAKFKTLLKFPSRELEVFYRKRIRKIVYFWPIYYWRHFS